MCDGCRYLELEDLYPENKITWSIFNKYLVDQVFIQGETKSGHQVTRVDLSAVISVLDRFIPEELFSVCFDGVLLLFKLRYNR